VLLDDSTTADFFLAPAKKLVPEWPASAAANKRCEMPGSAFIKFQGLVIVRA
jgi:hypothetical protein